MDNNRNNHNAEHIIVAPSPAGPAERPQAGGREKQQGCECAKAHDEYHASGGGTTKDEKASMAVPVTRHAIAPENTNYQPLTHGIDTLDIGMYVQWGPNWKHRLRILNEKKQRAREKGGLLVRLPSGRTCIVRPGGKGENYRFHLQLEAYNLFIGKTGSPGSTPNVYVSISAKALWRNGIDSVLPWITEDLQAIGSGAIQLIKVSRADLCADFVISGGLSHEFLLSHKVTRNDKGKLFLDGNDLQTYYAADAKSPIQLRLYNKGAEIKKDGTKDWFLDIWQLETSDDVWRVEYQLRRPALKQFGIHSLDDLKENQSSLWDYLTTKWFSLRLPDNEKAERRTVHPFWLAVQESYRNHATCTPVKRAYRTTGTAAAEWYISHINGCLSSFASLFGITQREDAFRELQNQLARKYTEEQFQEEVHKKSIQRGTSSKEGAV